MAVTQKVTLYNNKFTVPPVINAVQNDTDRQVEAYFGDFTLQVGMTGKLSFIRSDGTHYEVSATLNTGANTATAELDQALTQAGVTQAQLKITDSGNVGSTFTFMIKVQPDVAGISVPQDGWSAQEFDQRLTDAENAIDAVEEDVADLQEKEYDYAPVITDTASGTIATFPDGADSYPLKECVVQIDAVQSGSGDPSPDNIRPISGWSSAKVTTTGVNIWNEEWELGIYDSETGLPVVNNTAIRSKSDSPIRVKPSETYYFKTPTAGRIYYYDENDNYISRSSSISNDTFTTPNNCKYARFFIGSNYGTTYNHDISVNSPSTDTAYHQYVGQTYTISLGDTRYGCKLDVTRGKLRVTHAYVQLDGTESWNTTSNYCYAFGFSPSLTQGGDTQKGSHFVTTYTYNSGDSLFCQQNWAIIKSNRNDVTAWKAYLAQQAQNGTPVQLVYKLATSIEVDLTPTEITTLLGINNVWADTGDITVEYCADTKRYIQKLISALS